MSINENYKLYFVIIIILILMNDDVKMINFPRWWFWCKYDDIDAEDLKMMMVMILMVWRCCRWWWCWRFFDDNDYNCDDDADGVFDNIGLMMLIIMHMTIFY